jgi:hypothetical protein
VSEALDPRDALLRRLLLEEADPLAAFARSELAGDASARAELEELLDAERRVGAIAAAERAALRPSAPGSPERAAEERLLERLRAHLAEKEPVRTPVRRAAPMHERSERKPFAKIALLLAAMLALFLGWRWFGGSDPEPDPDTKLGSEVEISIREPVLWSGEIAWISDELPANAHFVVHVLDGTPGNAGTEVDVSPALRENHWTPTEAQWTSWPDEIRIQVELRGLGPDESYGSSDEVRARRSP